MEYTIGLTLKNSQEKIDFPVIGINDFGNPTINYKNGIISFIYDIDGYDPEEVINVVNEYRNEDNLIEGISAFTHGYRVKLQFNTEKFDEIDF